jgi:hypothetical protein
VDVVLVVLVVVVVVVEVPPLVVDVPPLLVDVVLEVPVELTTPHCGNGQAFTELGSVSEARSTDAAHT